MVREGSPGVTNMTQGAASRPGPCDVHVSCNKNDNDDLNGAITLTRGVHTS